MKDPVHIYFNRQLGEFRKRLSRSSRGFDMEDIHQLRLSVKRIRALFQFLEYADPGRFDARKDFRTVKKVFKLAGSIRDIQVQYALLDRNETGLQKTFHAYREFLESKEHAAIRAFDAQMLELLVDGIPDFERTRSSIQEMQAGDELYARTVRLLNEKIARIDTLRKDLSNDEAVHEIRTLLKQIHYIFDFTRKMIRHKTFLKMSLLELKKIEKTLGEWHDLVNGVTLIGEYLNIPERTAEEREAVQPLIGKMQEDRRQYLEQITRIMKRELIFHYILDI
ncbi:MAG: CHAD domain-containing protein [Bacteroidales bacterium]|nr:CHAD domain-containing protein [Bacteroidales bacterium]